MEKEYAIQIYIEELDKWITLENFSDTELDKAYHRLEFYINYPHNKYRLTRSVVLEEINNKEK